MSEALVVVRGLEIGLASGGNIVEDLDLSVARGEVLGVVGESGSGKTTAALALLGYSRSGVRITGGSVRVAGQELIGRPESELRRLRGAVVSYVPQEPATALNPSRRVGDQIRDVIAQHLRVKDPRTRVGPILERVRLPSDESFARRFPYQLSGGQQQRVAIAMALACEPALTVLDEPTTGLDVVTQHHILAEIDRLRRELELAVVYVSHDLAVVATIADRISVMYAGSIVEDGPTRELLSRPQHPYTRGLIASIPDHLIPRRLKGIPGVAEGVGERANACRFLARCGQRVTRCESEIPALIEVAPTRRVRCFEWHRTPPVILEAPVRTKEAIETESLLSVAGVYAAYSGHRGAVAALADLSFALARGECLALVGESGSGKTTAARCIAGLHAPTKGSILLDGTPLAPLAKDRPVDACRRIQIVFQNPYDSLNPRRTVGDAIQRPARILRRLGRRQSAEESKRLLERVRLPSALSRRFPRELSGGERQRVAIARALAANPSLVVCDEITSALDVSVQAAILDLLAELRSDLGLALIFISHDLGVVASVADRALVLDHGTVCERGPVRDLLSRPKHEYTKQLLAAAPRMAS